MLKKIVDAIDDLGIPFDYIYGDDDKIVVVRAHCSHNEVVFEATSIDELYEVVMKKKNEVDLLMNQEEKL